MTEYLLAAAGKINGRCPVVFSLICRLRFFGHAALADPRQTVAESSELRSDRRSPEKTTHEGARSLLSTRVD